MKNVIGWILAVSLTLLFALVGGLKLIGAPAMVKEFAQIGFGQWFRFFTGILEVAGAVGLLVPKFRFWATLLIATIMFCATLINVWVLHVPGLARVTGVLMALALVVGWLRRPQRAPIPIDSDGTTTSVVSRN
jgi:putative oxidoreductase